MSTAIKNSFIISCPVIALGVYQLFWLIFLHDNYEPQATEFTIILLAISYISFLSSLLYGNYIVFSKSENVLFLSRDNSVNPILRMFFFVAVSIVLFIPSVKLFIYIMENGYVNIRAVYFSDYDFLFSLYGGKLMMQLSLFVLKPTIYFIFILFIISRNNFKAEEVFFIVSLFSFSVATAGRFAIYWIFIVFFLRFLLLRSVDNLSFRKIAIASVFLFVLSIGILIFRVEQQSNIFTSLILSLLEYHAVPILLLAEKIDNGLGDAWFIGYPLLSTLSTLPSLFFPLFNIQSINSPVFYFGELMNDFSLSSDFTGKSFNAFSTFLIFFYSDFGFLMPIFIFIYVSVLFFTVNLVAPHLRLALLLYINVSLFFSLFQSAVFEIGFQFSLVIILLYSFFYKFYRKREF